MNRHIKQTVNLQPKEQAHAGNVQVSLGSELARHVAHDVIMVVVMAMLLDWLILVDFT